MKNLNAITRASLMTTVFNNAGWFAGLLAGSAMLGSPSVLAATWNGTISSDWNTFGNWSGSTGGSGTALINSVPSNVPTISANINPVPTAILVGSTGTARVNHVAGTATMVSGNDLVLGRTGSANGTYNLANTAATGGPLTNFGQGSGSLAVPDQLYVGGSAGTGTGTLNIHTTGTLSTGNQVLVGNLGGNGTVKMDSGTFTVAASMEIGNATASIGNFSISGGSLSVGTSMEVGNASGGTGTFSMSGGSLTVASTLEIGDGAGSTGTFSISGGTISKSGNSTPVAVGAGVSANGGTGTLNLNGGTFTTAGVMSVGHRPSTNGNLNVSAGTLNVNNDLNVGSYTGATGNVVISGGTINSSGWVVIGRRDDLEGVAVGGVGHVVMHGGTWNKTGASNFIVGAHGQGTMDMDGGLVDVGTDPAADRGITWVGEQNNCTGILSISGSAEFRTRSFTLGVQTGTTGTLNLNGGTVKTTRISGGAGTAAVVFNGTQIIATGSSAGFIDGLDTATIDSGGLRVDTAGFNLTAPQYLEGSGGVIKSGAGVLTLSAGNAFTGNHVVNGGKLAVESSRTGSGDYTIANGATLGVIQSIDLPLEAYNFTFGTAGNSSLDIEIGSGISANPSTPALASLGTLTLNGTVTVNISQVNPEVGAFPLVSYAVKAGTGSFVLGTLPPGVSAVLTDDNAGMVTLEITSISLPKWTGEADILNATGAWDTTTLNWFDQLSSLPTPFSNGVPVLFDDTAAGPSALALNGTVSPGGMRFENSTLPYSIDGTGKITGTTGLVKNGTAALTINTANDFTGTVELNGGIVTMGHVNALGTGSSPVILNTASLNFTGSSGTTNHGLAINAAATQITTANDITFNGQITSTGNFIKEGAGNLTFAYPGANVLGSVANGVLVHAGTLTLNGGGTQTNQVTGELWLADQPDIPANLVLNNSSLTTTNWLAIGRGNGDNGVVNLTATGSTITTVNFSTGFDNGLANNASEAFVTIHNTTWTNNGFTYLAESQGSSASMSLTGNSQFNINNDLLLTRNAANSQATLTLSDTSHITKTGGYTSIGTNGAGYLTVQNSAVFTSLTGDFNIGDVGTSAGTLNLKDSGVVNVNNVYIGKGSGTSGTFNQTGGTFSSASFIMIGRSSGSYGTVNLSGGTFASSGTIYVGEQGSGTLSISGNAIVTAGGNALYLGSGPVNFGGNGTLNLDGGTVIAKQLSGGLEGNSAVNFNGGLLKAAAGANANFVGGLDAVTILSGGARIDTNGQNLAVSQVLSGSGGFTKSGAGTLTLSGANTYTGPTSVNAGTLSVTTASFENTSAISIATGAVLNLPHGLTDQVGSLTINGTSMPAGIYDSTTSPGIITGTGKLSVTGAASAYDTWMAGYPSIPLSDRDPSDDPDADGFNNALEFALGGIPNSGSGVPKVYSLIADSSADGDATKELLMTIAVRAGTPAFSGSPSPGATQDGHTYRIQGSTTLGAFTTTAIPVNPVTSGLPTAPSGYEYRTFSLGGSNGIPAKGFLRVGVEYP